MIREAEEVHVTGMSVGSGSFHCLDCSFPVSLRPDDEMPECPNCGGSRFRRSSMFEQPTLSNVAVGDAAGTPTDWIDEAREEIEGAGAFVAYYADGAARVVGLSEGWSRIGRSTAADIRLDDPTVSRRHAVVVNEAEGKLRVLDDRSLNGIHVNGERVDWSPLADGDELQIGRYCLHVIEAA